MVDRITRHAAGFSAIAAIAALGPGICTAWTVQNHTGYLLQCTLKSSGTWTVPIGPHANASCGSHNLICNPSNSDFTYHNLEIVTNSGSVDFFGRVAIRADGTVLVDELPRPWGLPAEIVVSSYDGSGALIDQTVVSSGGTDPRQRNLQFLATADCQYFSHFCCDINGENPQDNCNGAYSHECNQYIQRNALADDTHAQMRWDVEHNRLLRGIIMAGDITQEAAFASEYASHYRDSWQIPGDNDALDFIHLVYDGLGNHDFGAGELQIMNDIRTRKRNTVRTVMASTGVPHYSWDWNDVHFVQLNLMPADDPSVPGDGLDPNNALSFLIADLATFVGASHRPVVLIHHYGLDDFSTVQDVNNGTYWWRPDQRLAYWNAIANYNVAAILSGHIHTPPNGPEYQRHVVWYRPAGAVGGPNHLDDFVCGGALAGAYIEVSMGANNQVLVTTKNQNGTVQRVDCALKGDAVYVNKSSPVAGDGGPDYPWKTVADGAAAATTIDSHCIPSGQRLAMRISAGAYNETITIANSLQLVANGGLVRIGAP